MSTIVEIAGIVDGSLFVICLLTFIWGCFRDWEMEILIPIAIFFKAQKYIIPITLLAIIATDHLHVTLK